MSGGRAEKTERVQAWMGLHEEHEVEGRQPPKTVLRQVLQNSRSETIERHDADVDVGVDGTPYRAAGSVLALLSQFQA